VRSLPKRSGFSQPRHGFSCHDRRSFCIPDGASMTAFTLAHLSDVHLPPLPAVRPLELV
jgi:hypothetical protein